MSHHSLHLVTVVLFAAICCSLANERAPNIITISRGSEIPYKLYEDVTLYCQAEGDPTPEYSWRKNGVPLNLSNPHYTLQQGTGNLIIKSPTESDDGEYNCLASNRLGTAVGMKMKVQRAVIEPFPTIIEPTVVTPIVGDWLKIPCSPPKTYPKGSAYFGYNVKDHNKLENIVNDNRVLLDYEGNLYFANVRVNDSLSHLGDKISYLCVVNNALLGAYVQGNDHKVVPREIPGRPATRPVQLLWPQTATTIAIKGQTKLLKCIFGGLPTPDVKWHSDKPKAEERFVVTPEGYGTEIRFDNVELNDEGYYTCVANNTVSGPFVPHRIKMTVQSAPFWSKKPVDLDVDEESDIEVDCQAGGTPKPTVTWSINGEPVNESHFHGRKSLVGYKLRYHDVAVNDSQVIQCLATNEHGTILANVILKVNAEPPSFLETPEDKKVVKGTSVLLKCNTRGAPKPTITWTRGKPPSRVSGRRFVVHPSGTLEIQDTDLEDTDNYRCQAQNKHGDNDASAELTVRSPTIIRSVPTEKVVEATDEVIVPCDVTTDPAEASNLVVEWYKNGEQIDLAKETHMYMDNTDHSLHIKSSKVKDTAGYTCNASNGLDSANSEVFLLKVKDRPDPPYDVDVFQCGARVAGISWLPGSDNNDPIIEFTVHYNSSSSSQNFTHYRGSGEHFHPNKQVTASVEVRPWSRYTFYVTAANSLGRSKPSGPTGKGCNTLQEAPYRNPTGVCSRLGAPTQLVIVWDPLSEDEQNGEGFHYIVSYKRHKSSEPVHTQKIMDPRLSSLPIHDQPMFTQYEISVQSANNMGVVPLQPGEKKLAFSGEGKPRDVPQNFRQGELMNGSYAEFLWDPVDTRPERIQGFFRGYLIEFWRSEEPDVVRSEEVLIDTPFDLCPPLEMDDRTVPLTVAPNRRRRHHHPHHRVIRSPSPVKGFTNKLWPNSRISAAVRVLSQGQVSNRSNVIEFNSPEGVPGRVSSLKVIERGSGHLRVEWQLPVDASGPILAYEVEYRVAPPAVGRTLRENISNPFQLTYKIRNLAFSTKYQISVAAFTGAGIGEPETVFGETLPFMDPDAPVIGKITRGENSANVSWIPSGKQPPENPGSGFYVEYRGGDGVWRRVDPDPESNDNWANITDLEPGKYEVRVVATTGTGDDDTVKETRSKVWIVYIGPEGPEPQTPAPDTAPLVYHQASTGWFIILMCIIALLLLVLIIICILRRSRGDVYPVYEKEKMWRHQPLAPDEAPFGEYTAPSDNPNLTRSQGSLDSDEKPMDSDSDSLGEYEDQDASKFNEDGSFIGLYSGKQKAEPTAPSAMNTMNTSV